MSLRFPNTCFVHIPRTGGIWLQEVTRKLDILKQVFKGDVDSHFTYQQLPDNWKKLKSFTFVRNPLDWLKSRWSHARLIDAYENHRHYGVHREFDECVRTTLADTIKAIVNRHKGLVGKTYREMSKGVKTIFKSETVTEKLKDYLYCTENINQAKYQATVNILASHNQAINTSSQLPQFLRQLELPNDIANEFINSEREAYKIWESAL